MTEHYSIVRQIKKMPQAVPGKVLDNVSYDLKREEDDKRHTEQLISFRQSEAKAKGLIDQMPDGTKYLITRRCDESPTGEMSFEVSIKNKNDKGLKFSPDGLTLTESSNYLGFCLQTGLMIRNSEGLPIENTDLIEKLNQTYSKLPQSRALSQN